MISQPAKGPQKEPEEVRTRRVIKEKRISGPRPSIIAPFD